MAKLFYTLEEAAKKLRKSTDEVMGMAKAGQLQELRDKDQVLFRRSAIDQIAGDTEMESDLNLDALELTGGGSSIQLGGSSVGGIDDLRLDDSVPGSMPAAAPASGGADELRLDDDLRMDDDLRLDDGPTGAPAAPPMAASGADESIGLDELTLADDDAPAPAPVAARAAAPAPRSPAASSGGSRIGLADSNAESMMADAPMGSQAAARLDDSMAINPGATQLETVGSGSGLLDISSDESFFGAQMIEESMGGDEAAALPDNAADIFGGGEAASEEAAPVTAGTTGVTFGTATLAEARDPMFSGFTGGAMVAAAVALVGMGWAVAEMSVGNYVDIAKMIAENWMYVLGGAAGAILVFGGIGFGIGKATA